MHRLVVDTDGGSDDAVALLLAALDDRAELHAVTTVAGNVPLAQASRNMLLTLELAGAAEVPLYEGCDRPMVRPLATAQHVHGADGMGDGNLPAAAGRPHPRHAADLLVDLARERPGELTLVTLGPLTNLATALLRDRRLLHRFRAVWCMIGAPDAVGNVAATAEYNAWADPEAAEIVAQAAEPGLVTWVGWDVSRTDAVLTAADRRRLRELGPLGAFADRINRTVADWAATVTGLAGYDLPDAITMAAALRPDLVRETERVHLRVGLGDEARGQLLIDRRRTARPPNLTLVRRMDRDGFTRLLFDTLARVGSPA